MLQVQELCHFGYTKYYMLSFTLGPRVVDCGPMKRILKILGGLIGFVVLAGAGFAAYVQVDGIPHYPVEKIDLKVEATPERVARGKKLATLLCAQCHMNPTTRQLTGKHMEDAPPQFGVIYSLN